MSISPLSFPQSPFNLLRIPSFSIFRAHMENSDEHCLWLAFNSNFIAVTQLVILHWSFFVVLVKE